MKITALTLGLLVWGTLATGMAHAETPCEKPWLFFDLGENTILYTDGRDVDGNLADMHHMDGVEAYLGGLKAKGYHVNLLVNVPGEWDVNSLKNYITRAVGALSPQDPGGWTPGANPLDWNQFDHIITTTDADCYRDGKIPQGQTCRKPQHVDLPFAKGELWLYRQALSRVPEGCSAILQTGIKEEVLAAESVGMSAWTHPKTKSKMVLIAEEKLETLIKQEATRLQKAMAYQKFEEDRAVSQGREIPRRRSADATE